MTCADSVALVKEPYQRESLKAAIATDHALDKKAVTNEMTMEFKHGCAGTR